MSSSITPSPEFPLELEPKLPLELEHEIFLLALQNEASVSANIFLVAKRVNEWCTSFVSNLYKTVINYTSRKYPHNVTFESIKVYGHHTRHLLIVYDSTNKDDVDESTDAVLNFLSSCPNIERLALWFRGPNPYPCAIILIGLTKLINLRHLSIEIECLNYLAGYLEADVDYAETTTDNAKFIKELECKAKAFFLSMTHLEIQCDMPTFDQEAPRFEGLRRFNSLTHLCVPRNVAGEVANLADAWLDAFVILPSIKAIPADGEAEEELGQVQWSEFIRDRCVEITCSELDPNPVAAWEKGARTGEDIWVAADRIIKERRQERATTLLEEELMRVHKSSRLDERHKSETRESHRH
ncbi:hypothetical protein BDN72DRAFT_915167 [Pluteus cervinus]|uniref:Uncharacterized protein n=1 Tax=Pluteus cervinus TaxID=181527 RepID=A0ACD3AN92_9AGAR|nr:hypothetical protein BDN72DRAFT_915167 [Pluteus cervinus]